MVQTLTVSGAYPENVVGVTTFQARLPAASGTAEAELHQDGNPIEGVVLLDDRHPFARLHIELDGEKAGVFSVLAELDVSDEGGGRKEVLRTRSPIIVNVRGPFDDTKDAGKK